MAELIGARQMTNNDKKAAKLEKRLQEWKIVRQRGKYSYILRWGGLMSMIYACGNIYHHHLNSPKIGFLSVAYYLTIWILWGFSIGLAMWYGNDHRYLCAMKQQDSTKDDSKGKQ
jgi:hypothetical protein